MSPLTEGVIAHYDLGMLPLELLILRRLRRRLIPHLEGNVLEIGVGTGANLPFYAASPENEVRVTAVDIDAQMLRLARRRGARGRRRATLSFAQANAQQLPFVDETFDHVVGSFVFCSIDDPTVALGEICRTLRPGGWLWLLEHVRGESVPLRWLTDTLAGPWLRLSHSCHLNRDTAATVQAAGLKVVCVRSHLGGVVQTIWAHKV
jgi:ubiquinone/menaquinone biosynthesis C-methylase UbiE